MKDFFISYNNADRKWGEWIAWQLEEASYTTVIQAWDSLPGDNFVLWMQKAASEAKQTLAVLSQAYIDALFSQPEWAAAFRRDPTGAKGTLLPVRVEACDPTGLLPAINYIDLVDLEEDAAKEALLTGVKRERIKPTVAPGFPVEPHHSLPQQPEFPGLLSKRSAIKFLRPFDFDDAELFVRLQRENSLKECLAALIDRDFRLGVLSAESGCGKTSFLQAGIWPTMNNQSDSHHAVYVKFTDADPFETVRSALQEQTQLSKKQVTGLDFLPLLRAAIESEQKTLVLLFDQFEQFFVHHQRQKERQPFIDALAEWYRHSTPPSVKILLSIRSDFFGRLVEVQKALGYHLRPQDLFELNKFTPAQATEIFAVMAETADLSFDRDFVEEMTEQELADKDDGLISPVDIQILAWMIQGQQSGVKGGFNKQVYQRMGGIEGLLENFLSHVMKSLISDSQREIAMKVLLSLVDLEGNARAGVLTREQIGQKLTGKVKQGDLETGLARLAESRLITPGKRNGSVGYELAHERLIPALRRFAGKELSEVERVN
ncbi:toll/interleukin-1 receptor domain-containing protein, partial [candidate division KSB1 bacterium]|nr:toll/interleukin-1 receptor domain-containing protein [candidate division KSB1 bacterium]NIS24120.1 toll/interleukin-1 receptor domain-containing protein [candidate division KSB1 bacterium]NIT71037.1 toll/interleukin-1 receptor domain-containing protein [candidate division KSB1 bacterium]NIU24739.1 toll/interleukin-1 receptor domain-containing protein [candidate division KSB1 bacterium]NIU90221.1 TIR domain-containing protein [candidate division KSB1 bacterium]